MPSSMAWRSKTSRGAAFVAMMIAVAKACTVTRRIRLSAPLGEMIMTQDHVKNFEKARDQLLAQRRSLAEALAGGYKRGQTENHIERIVNVQAAIDVIMAAINQEHLAAPAPPTAPAPPEDRWR
jgi:hypothetical protein